LLEKFWEEFWKKGKLKKTFELAKEIMIILVQKQERLLKIGFGNLFKGFLGSIVYFWGFIF
jgi:hypothetical protein